MSVVLVGAPGSGKSTVGALVADRLGRDFVDVDARVEQVTGREIAEIFATDGESTFRALEEEQTLAALAGADQVVSLGGGAVMNDAIAAALAGHDVVWLDVPAGVAADRVGMNVARPLLLGNVRGRLAHLLRERRPRYEQVATIIVDAAAGDPASVAAEVVERLDGRPIEGDA